MSSSDSDSPLSSPPASEDEKPVLILKSKKSTALPKKKAAAPPPKIKLKPPARSPSPEPRKRKKEPPHKYTIADHDGLAVIVMFRSRFSDAFKGVPNFGCQDLERGVVDTPPSELIEQLLCRLIGLVLNRKKPVERGHHNRALEEAIHAHQQQWPRSWEYKNPLPGSKTFNDLSPDDRLSLLKILVHWALISSEQVRSIINENYKGSRREDDLNVPVSVQPLGRDGDKRRYWLIEGKDDTPFRLYRESNPALKTIQWISVAGTIDEIRQFAKELEEDDATKHALALRDRIMSAIPRFEDGEIRRKKREYRQQRKAFFAQTGGVSLYEGRTRGKRIKYTFSDDEGGKESAASADDTTSAAAATRRSARSLRTTPAPEAPRFTASGRQIRKPNTGVYGELKTYGSAGASAEVSAPTSDNGIEGYPNIAIPAYNFDVEEDEAKESDAGDDGEDWRGGDTSEDDDADDESGWDEYDAEDEKGNKRSLRIVLKVNGRRVDGTAPAQQQQASTVTAPRDSDVKMPDIQVNGVAPCPKTTELAVPTPAPMETKTTDIVMADAGAPNTNGTTNSNEVCDAPAAPQSQ